jgi:hypothetical protein
VIEICSDGGDLAQFELGEAQTPPALSGADECAEHELEHRLLAKAIGNDLQPSTLLDEQPFEKVCGANETAVGDRQPQVRDAQQIRALTAAGLRGIDVVQSRLHAIKNCFRGHHPPDPRAKLTALDASLVGGQEKAEIWQR